MQHALGVLAPRSSSDPTMESFDSGTLLSFSSSLPSAVLGERFLLSLVAFLGLLPLAAIATGLKRFSLSFSFSPSRSTPDCQTRLPPWIPQFRAAGSCERSPQSSAPLPLSAPLQCGWLRRLLSATGLRGGSTYVAVFFGMGRSVISLGAVSSKCCRMITNSCSASCEWALAAQSM